MIYGAERTNRILSVFITVPGYILPPDIPADAQHYAVRAELTAAK